MRDPLFCLIRVRQIGLCQNDDARFLFQQLVQHRISARNRDARVDEFGGRIDLGDQRRQLAH